MKKFWSFLMLSAIWFACDVEKEKCAFIPPQADPVDVTFGFYHDSLANVTSKQHLVNLLTRQPLIRDYIFRRTAYPNDSVFINAIFSRLTHAAFDTLQMETHRVFADLSALKAQFVEAFTNLKYYYPGFVPPKVQTVISGLDTDLFVSDSLIIVGLDFYLGKGAKYRPNLYAYLLRQYEKENIVPSCMLIYGISNRFNKTDAKDKTVLADMIAYGKAYYFAKHMLPCVADSVLTWYTAEEIEGARQNQDIIWSRIIEDRVLYATSHMVKQRYLGERPKTLEVGEKCPGRIGQWVGWQIVQSYMDSHPEVSLPELMNQSDAQKLFRESKYKPERR